MKASFSGLLGSVFAALCCIGFPVLVGLLGTIGAGFLINDKFLFPLLALSLSLSLYGLISAYKKRHHLWPLILGIMGGAIIFPSIFYWSAGVYIGLMALLLATIKNIRDGYQDHRDK
jgi:mercuric ion transport protein